MASVKVILYTSKILKNGEHPIMIRLIKDRKTKYLSLGHSCHPDLWDNKENLPKKKHPSHYELVALIRKKVQAAEKLVLNLETEKGNFTFDEYESKLKKVHTPKLLFQFIDEIITNLKKIDKLGNAKVYQTIHNSLYEFNKKNDISFSNINASFLNRYEQFLRENGLSENSMSNYFRTFRAIYNKAVMEGYARKDEYPFDAFKISKFNTKTAKRALSIEEFQKIKDLTILESSPLFDAHLYFLFSFYTMGTNFVDMAKLEWKDISGGRLRYKRTKTDKEYNLKLTKPALDIIAYYKTVSTGDYIFPILDKQKHKTQQSIVNRIHKIFSQYNKKLKEIVVLSGLDVKVTSYVARHSSATIMKRQGVSVEKISELMGHDDVKTTQIYLDEFGSEELDDAMNTLVF